MIRLTGYLKCSTSEEVELITTYLPDHVQRSREEAGCRSFSVIETDDPLVWKVEEVFADQSSFDAHQRRTKASVWGKATASIAREYRISTHQEDE